MKPSGPLGSFAHADKRVVENGWPASQRKGKAPPFSDGITQIEHDIIEIAVLALGSHIKDLHQRQTGVQHHRHRLDINGKRLIASEVMNEMLAPIALDHLFQSEKVGKSKMQLLTSCISCVGPDGAANRRPIFVDGRKAIKRRLLFLIWRRGR